jgi:hypothetical protein
MFPSAQAAELTSGHYRSFEKEGLEARVDLASQVLQLNVPEEKHFVWQHLETNAPEATPQEAAIRPTVAGLASPWTSSHSRCWC